MTDPRTLASAKEVEEEARRLWSSRLVPPGDGFLGPHDGPLLRQFLGTFTPGDPPELIAHRAVVADVDARYLALTGRRVLGTLRREGWPTDEPDPAIHPMLLALGVWTGGVRGRPWEAADWHPGIQGMVSRLAQLGALVARDGPLRVCPKCAAPRSPERIIYQQELGDTYLVRFPLRGYDPPVDALVWVDAPWRLLGANALLVHPDVTYATVDYTRKEVTARLLTTRSSLERLKAWLPGSSIALVEEHAGRELVGRAYTYPLRHEFPIGGDLNPPAGTIQAVPDVGDTGTGIVPLVPGHGGTDAQIAERLGIAGWPLLTPHGLLDPSLMHEYSGLDVETANAFVARDLSEGGSVLARLRVVRGVPYCALCGHSLVWMPGRAWCLEIRNLPPAEIGRYARLLPGDRPIGQIEITPWPISETVSTVSPSSITLLECGRCERLDAPEGPMKCPCGGTRRRVSRRLLPSITGTFAAWARNEPLAPTDSIRIYANERRRAPSLVHHLLAMAGARGAPSDVGLTVVPTVGGIDVGGLIEANGADAVRAAFVRAEFSEGAGGTFAERVRQEAARLQRLRSLAGELLDRCGPNRIADLAEPTTGADRDLEPEDRAILARWARTELLIVGEYARWKPSSAQRLLYRFFGGELEEYRSFVRSRLEAQGMPPSKRSSLRTLAHIVRSGATLLAPIAPFTAETIHRMLLAEPRSLFERHDLGSDAATDERLALAWDRWHGVVAATDRFRRDRRLPPGTVLPSVVLVLADDDAAEKLRADRTVLEKLGRIGHLVVGSPSAPWPGRRRRLVAVESEVRRVYPSLVQPIVHLVNRLPPRRSGEEAKAEELSVVVQGQPLRITPTMVTTVDVLPDRTVPVPFARGEMYIEAPPSGSAERSTPPPLSPDGFWLLRRVERALRRDPLPPGSTPRVALAVAVDPLATELRDNAPAIARYLGLAELRVVDQTEESRPRRRISGRTRTGAAWWVSVPGLSRPTRPEKHRNARAPTRRIPRPTDTGEEIPGVDYGAESVVAQAEAVRTLGLELDGLLEAELLGPSKVAIAWDAGLRSVQQFSEAPFDQLVAVPGIGRSVASRLWKKLGKEVPRPPPLARTRPRPLRSSPSAPPTLGATAVELATVQQTLPAVPERSAGHAIAMPAPTVTPPKEPPSSEREAPTSLAAVVPSPEESNATVTSGDITEAPPAARAEEADETLGVVPAVPEPEPPLPAGEAPVAADAIPAVVSAPPVPEVEPPAPEAPPAPPPEPPPPPPPTGLEVDLSESLLPALEPFLEETAAGHHGVAVVREMPDRIQAHVGPRPVAVYWLTNLARDRALKPNDLAVVFDRLNRSIDAEGVTAVFLEGVEYLVRIHGIDRIVRFLAELDASLKAHDARGWLHLTPSLLPESDVDRILTGLGVVRTASTEPEPATPSS